MTHHQTPLQKHPIRHETGDDRAQPGDVLGIERGGERTHLGETREDEDDRRRDAERAAQDRAPEAER